MTSPSDPPTWAGSYGPPPTYGPPMSYGPPPVGQLPVGPGYWTPAPQTDGTAVAALVLACCSWFVFPVIPAIIALVLASSSERDIDAAGGRLTGDGLITAARWVSWLNIALFVGGLVVLMLFFAAVFTV